MNKKNPGASRERGLQQQDVNTPINKNLKVIGNQSVYILGKKK